MLSTIETGKALPNGHADQAAVVPVGPAVIGAGDGRGAVSRTVHQPPAASPADILKAGNRALAITQHHDALGPQIEGLVVARLGDGIDVTHDLPARQQNASELEPGQFAVVVNPGGQCGRQGADGLIGTRRDGQGGHGFPRRRLYGHLMYAAGCTVGKSEQRSKLFEAGNSGTKGMRGRIGRLRSEVGSGTGSAKFIWSYKFFLDGA